MMRMSSTQTRNQTRRMKQLVSASTRNKVIEEGSIEEDHSSDPDY